MKTISVPQIFLMVLLFSGCGPRTGHLREDALALARTYAKEHVQSAEIKENGGQVMIGDHTKRYLIDTSLVFTGALNADTEPDALVSLEVYEGDFGVRTEHLILIHEGNLRLDHVVTSDMKVLAVKDGLIIAEVPTKPRSSPLFNCHSCRELHDFRFENDSLVQVR
jgi:hypothetical protein